MAKSKTTEIEVESSAKLQGALTLLREKIVRSSGLDNQTVVESMITIQGDRVVVHKEEKKS